MTDEKTKYHQSLVSRFPDKNAALTAEQRFVNLEHDTLSQGDCLRQLVDQNNKYALYLDSQITAEEENVKFWKSQREKAMSVGIFGFIGLTCSAILYAFTHWVKSL